MHIVLRNRLFLVLDLFGWLLLPVLALGLELNGFAPVPQHLPALLLYGAVSIPGKFLALWSFGLYRRYWRYASIYEFSLIGVAVLCSAVVVGVVFALVQPLVQVAPRLPVTVSILDGLMTLIYVGGVRFAPRAIQDLELRAHGREHAERVLIAGAGSAGTMIARELMANPQLKLNPVGFVDDDPSKRGNTIQGVPVLGSCQSIPSLAKDFAVGTVIIAMPTVPGVVIREIRETCERAKLQTKTIPGVFEIISGRVSVTQLRDVQIEDLLGRHPVQVDEESAAELVRGMTVMVTGAGGSIGSEICRQVARLGAAKMILLGHGENSIFEVYHDLVRKRPNLELVPVIADIRDARRIAQVFRIWRPHAVFHAAAHKHVPLMELNPEEAVTNNVSGTATLLAAAEEVGVSHFVFISTDKAVNPASVMGATKLVAEQLVHEAGVRTGRPYVSVRFGNVLASRGSVVPLFQKQIAAGGPVTVTHPAMCRYLMTIPEAVRLVVQAAVMGKAGESFVLDMGEPVKIVDLAHDLIRLSGYEIGDIEVTYTGLRPGEKLSEELFANGEAVEQTSHPKVFRVRNGRPAGVIQGRVTQLTVAAAAGDTAGIRQILHELVPTPSENGRPDTLGTHTYIRQASLGQQSPVHQRASGG